MRIFERGFSILELMIALGLLSVLMLLGWGMMDSLQRSQERSWKLTQRVRVLRLTRSWLSADMDHLASGVTFGSNPNDPGSVPASFEGDITGFTATILPSIDPVPFLQRLGDESRGGRSEQGEITLESLGATPEELATQEWKQSLWSGERIDVEYRLEPIYEQDVVLAEIQDPESIQYELVRREWIPDSYFDQFRSTTQPAGGVQSSKPPRKGSGAELARSNPLEAMAAEETEWIPPLKEIRLYGVIKPKFQYFDGSQWLEEWSSGVQGGCPRQWRSRSISLRSRNSRSPTHRRLSPSPTIRVTRRWSLTIPSLRSKPRVSMIDRSWEDWPSDWSTHRSPRMSSLSRPRGATLRRRVLWGLVVRRGLVVRWDRRVQWDLVVRRGLLVR